MVVVMYVFASLRIVPALLLGWLVFAAFVVVIALWTDFGRAEVFAYSAIIFAANLVGMFACYNTELFLRREYLLRRDVAHERRRSERLLLNILPASIADRLRNNESVIADHFPEVTVILADIVDFSKRAARLDPHVLVETLNALFTGFDAIADDLRLEKIKTIGDAYMVVSGLPEPRDDHVRAGAEMALAMRSSALRHRWPGGDSTNLRIGLSTGEVVAGVIGTKKFIYDLWGDTVNIASRMESQGIAGAIQVTVAVYDQIRNDFEFAERGKVEVKGRGEIPTYLLLGRFPQPRCADGQRYPKG